MLLNNQTAWEAARLAEKRRHLRPHVSLRVVDFGRSEIASAVVAADHVEEAIANDEARIAATRRHLGQHFPAVGFRIVAFGRSVNVGTVVAAHNIDFAVVDVDARATSSHVHRGDELPRVGERIISFDRAQALAQHTTIAAN